MDQLHNHLCFQLPNWIDKLAFAQATFPDDASKMTLAIELARQNIIHGTGGPFGAAIFQISTGKLISTGVNLVVNTNNSVLHAEVTAIMLAEKRLQSFSMTNDFEMFTSCEPCAMCLGASLWSGIKRIVCAATGEDARAIGFDEGPVFPESWSYMKERGIEIVHNFMRPEAKSVLVNYKTHGGLVYNAS